MAGSRPGPARVPRGEAEHGPSVYLAVERTPIMRLARSLDNRHWEAGAYGAVYRANLRIAREVQTRAARNLKATIVRKQQSTGTLEKAILDPRSVYADAQRIIIGVGDFMDARASYWRAVESGAPNLQGRVIFGFWTRAPRSERGKVALEGPMGGEKSGRPIVVSWDTPPMGMKHVFSWSIEHPTQAHWYFFNAWNDVGSSGFMERAYRDEFRGVLGPNGKPIILGNRFKAYHGRPVVGEDFRV